MSSRDDVAIGGGAGDEAKSELTGRAGAPSRKGALEPRVFDGMLRAGGKAAAGGDGRGGGASLWIVRDESALEAYRKLREAGGDTIGRLFAPAALPLKKDDSVRFLWPRPRGVAGASVPTALFPSSQEFTRKDGGLAFLLEQHRQHGAGRALPDVHGRRRRRGSERLRQPRPARGASRSRRVLAGPLDLQAAGRPAIPGDPAGSSLRLVARRGTFRRVAVGKGRRRRYEPRAARRLRAPARARSTRRQSSGSKAACSRRRSRSPSGPLPDPARLSRDGHCSCYSA